MLVTAECIPCYLQQAINTLEKGKVKREERSQLLKELLPIIGKLPEDRSPAENSSILIHHLVKQIGGQDPFAEAKQDSNKQAIAFMERLTGVIEQAEDPLFTALKVSVAGNVVDLGLFDDFDLSSAIEDALKFDFAINDYADLTKALNSADKVLIVGDNSGEIAFDKLLSAKLIEMGKEVVYGVKGGFVLNDATIDDAREVGLTELVKVIDNGNNFLGTIEKFCSEEFLKEFHSADLIISKGQANYESLEGTPLAGNNTYFILKAKCPVVAGHLGVNYGDIVLARNKVNG